MHFRVIFIIASGILVLHTTQANDISTGDGVQLKLENCRQSSDYNGKSRCTGAIDGTTSQQWSYTGFATTNNDAQPWWETQTEQVTEFTKVQIFNRQDCCPERLNNFVIKVDGQVCAEYNSATAFSVQTFECKRKGRVIRIESRIPTHLTLAEVQVFGRQNTTAGAAQLRLSRCQQSSNYQEKSRCTGAIDGKTSQSWSFEGASTTNYELRPWWEARTDVPSNIKQVRIFNRLDCCPDRLNNFVIKVDDVVCAEYNSHAAFSIWTFDCNRVGTVLRIESRLATHLTLMEVQAYGEASSDKRLPVQLKLRNCRQSSDYHEKSRCTGAIDGTTSQQWSYTGFATTNNDAQPWWETQTEQVTEFTKVQIFNRQDCCPERLNNFAIKVDGQVCAEYDSSTAFSVQTFPCRRQGRILRIESRIPIHLTLAEVQVYGLELGPKSVLPQILLSNCSQSSDYQENSRCTGAIDGTTSQSWTAEGASTTKDDALPWWEAQANVPSKFAQVRIFNRQDCCPERLNNFVIKVDGEVCAEYKSAAAFSVWSFDCNRIGTVLRIESRIRTHLTLMEVQAFGEPAVKECYRQQVAFVGTNNVTTTGRPCQSWSVRSCPDHLKGMNCHVPSSFVIDAGLTGNTCRNPLEYMRDRPWCYTTTATRWEYCNVAEC